MNTNAWLVFGVDEWPNVVGRRGSPPVEAIVIDHESHTARVWLAQTPKAKHRRSRQETKPIGAATVAAGHTSDGSAATRPDNSADEALLAARGEDLSAAAAALALVVLSNPT
jgi:hypothetical protein